MKKTSRFTALIEMKPSLEWLIDKTWPILWVTFGSSITLYLSSITVWLEGAGPAGMAFIFISSALAISSIFYLSAKARLYRLSNRRALDSINSTNTNPLDKKFEKQTIKLSEFYSPYYVSHHNKVFLDCDIVGPGCLMMRNGSMNNCDMRHCQIVILKHPSELDLVFGVTVFDMPSLVDCRLLNCTLFMHLDSYNYLPENVRKSVPVISMSEKPGHPL